MTQYVRDLMTSEVESTAPDASIQTIAEMMRQLNVGSIPVVENGNVCGLITARDIVLRVVANARDPLTTQVGDVMSAHVVSAEPDWDIQRAAQTMAEHQVRRLPVIDQGKLVGILALGDIAADGSKSRVSGEALSDISEPARPDR